MLHKIVKARLIGMYTVHDVLLKTLGCVEFVSDLAALISTRRDVKNIRHLFQRWSDSDQVISQVVQLSNSLRLCEKAS